MAVNQTCPTACNNFNCQDFDYQILCVSWSATMVCDAVFHSRNSDIYVVLYLAVHLPICARACLYVAMLLDCSTSKLLLGNRHVPSIW